MRADLTRLSADSTQAGINQMRPCAHARCVRPSGASSVCVCVGWCLGEGCLCGGVVARGRGGGMEMYRAVSCVYVLLILELLTRKNGLLLVIFFKLYLLHLIKYNLGHK